MIMNFNINNYTLSVGKRNLVNDITLNLKFEKMQISGKNGTGKTTFLKKIYNKDINPFMLNDIKMSFLNQNVVLMDKLSIEENLLLLVEDHKKILYEYLDNFPNLNRKVKVKNLSGGQKQYLNIAIAFAQNYDLILIDEPELAII